MLLNVIKFQSTKKNIIFCIFSDLRKAFDFVPKNPRI